MSLRGPNLSASLRCLDRVDEVLRRKRLWKIGHATDAQRGAARYVLIPRGYEYDGRRNPRGIQLSLQVDARSAIQVDIQNQASCGAQIGTLYEAVDRVEGLNVEPMHLEKPLDGSQNAEVIVEDVDKLA